MHHQNIWAAGLVALAALPGALAGIYTKNSPVLQVDAKSYDRLIVQSNYTSIVEFYAPWCGHCQNLKPAYEKAAKSLKGLAKVAAVDCDDDANKPLCGQLGIKGFPTIKIVRPGSRPGKPVVEDYQGARTASAMVDAVVDKINNHVKRVTDKDVDSFLSDNAENPKALLFTEKGTTSPLLRSITIDFLGVVTVGQVRNTQKAVVEKFGVEKFPTLLLLPPGDAEPIVYDGELKKDAMVAFISQLGEPNPDPPVKGEKKAKSSSGKKESKSADKEQATPEAAPEEPTESASTSSTPVAPRAPAIPTVDKAEKLQQECLTPKSHTCVLALVPADGDEEADKALTSLAELAFKYAQSKRVLFPFFAVPAVNPAAETVRKALGVESPVELVAVNARRGWWRHYEGAHDLVNIEAWIDAIRMSEGTKHKLPAELVVEPEPVKEEPKPEVKEEAEEPVSTEGSTADAPEPETEAPAEESTEVAKEDASETPTDRDEL
ncbi:hypothetical protein ACRALDRAFT_2102804 [Sodiomyces alcalophilus JCM 7366]|uniref:uncharacterized protein n=1 Tax=Sodiomyces alcalophilus JCM 7366 TaxID=591952 RepID=UPI0039B67E7A